MLKLRTFFQRYQQTVKKDLPSDMVTISFDELRAALKPFADKYNYEKHLRVPSSLDKDVINVRQALKNVDNNQAVVLRKILISIDSQALASMQAPYPKVTEFHFPESDLSSLYDELDFLMDLDASYKDCRVINFFNRAAYTVSADKSAYAELHDNLQTMLQRHEIKPQWRDFPTEARTTFPEDTPMVDSSVASLMGLVHPAYKDKNLSDSEELKQFLQTLYFDLKPESYPERFIELRRTLANAIADLYHTLPEQFPTPMLEKQNVVRPIKPEITINGFPEASVKIPQQVIQALVSPKTFYLVKHNNKTYHENNSLQHFNNSLHELIYKNRKTALNTPAKHATATLG